jgi:N-acetylmuramoyl-L-alanine amidase
MVKDTRTLVCLDPGHGGSDDPGASNQDIVIEKEINLMVANKVKNILEQNNYRIIMTRTSNDEAHNNNDRYTYCNTNKADILVSIHHNDFADPSVDYDTVLYYKNSDQALAESILTSTSQILGVSNNGITSFEDGVLSKSNMPAALSEAFFISSDYEFNQITKANSKRLNDEAQGIATGIMNYFKDMSVNTASGSL